MQIGLRNFVPILAAFVTLIAGTTIAETVAKMPLPQLASMRFGHLSAAEEELFEAAVNGEDADCADLSGEDRVIRGDLLSWLCTNQVASSYVTSAGLSIIGAEIDGEVAMKFAKVPFPILATKCDFDETITLLRTHLVALSLIRTAIKGMDASSLDVEQTVFLREIKAQEEVDLGNATIGSNLECDASRFVSKTTAQALNLEGANIHGYVLLRYKFEADGGVNMKGATIGGDLSCVDGRFIGSAYGLALDADSAKIVGHVFFSAGFEAEGVVRFTGVQVGRVFQWEGVKSPEKAFLDLRGSKIGTLWNDQKSSPASGHLLMDGCVYDEIDDEAPPNAKSQLGWLGRQPPDRFRSQPYEQLATVLRKMGLDEDARQVMIAKNEEHGRYLQSVVWDWHRPLALTRFFGWLWYGVFGNILIGYGYQPGNAFVISIGVILLGWWLFRRGYIRGLVTPKGSVEYVVAKDGPHPSSNNFPTFNAFIYSLETFVPLIKLGLSDYWTPNANRSAPPALGRMRLPPRTGSWLRVYLWIHIIAGWVLTTLWVGGLTGLLKN